MLMACQQQQQFLAYALVTKGLCLDTALQFAHKLIYQVPDHRPIHNMYF